jgi:sulfonate dioxygenase
MLTSPESGGDTLWSSCYALYSSLSPGFQTYLESLSAVHSAMERAERARATGTPLRREPIETVHPIVRVHPATGRKSIYVDPGGCYSSLHPPHVLDYAMWDAWQTIFKPFLKIDSVHACLTLSRTDKTKRIVGIPKAESDAILAFLFSQISGNNAFQMRHKWERNDVVIWDNRVSLSTTLVCSSPFVFFWSFWEPKLNIFSAG